MQQQVFIKKAAEGIVGVNPEERPLRELLTYSIVNLDKPRGPTSHQVAEYVQKITGLSKAGHSGTLEN